MGWRRAYVFVDNDTDEALIVEQGRPGDGLVVVDRWPCTPDDPDDAAERLSHVRDPDQPWPSTSPH